MISCILGSKDRKEKIEKCLASVYANYKSINVEPDIIIVDGGSQPELLAWLQGQPGVRLIKESMLHGVTRGYNRCFRLAKYKYVTWLSDDLDLAPDMFVQMSKHFDKIGDYDIMAISMNNCDGHGYRIYKDVAPVGFCTKKLMKVSDFWSEDYLTYYTDIDFCFKAKSFGGKLLTDASIKMLHYYDKKDELHKINEGNDICSVRGKRIWESRFGKFFIGERVYPNVFVGASSPEELLSKVQKVWREISWCNIYTPNLFGLSHLESMNVFEGTNDSICHYVV